MTELTAGRPLKDECYIDVTGAGDRRSVTVCPADKRSAQSDRPGWSGRLLIQDIRCRARDGDLDSV
ncbi:MAG: hypothetical protein CMF50_03625 [Legionellales bacterium]|nr:hypothetical protein [Legionellales bacterium]